MSGALGELDLEVLECVSEQLSVHGAPLASHVALGLDNLHDVSGTVVNADEITLSGHTPKAVWAALGRLHKAEVIRSGLLRPTKELAVAATNAASKNAQLAPLGAAHVLGGGLAAAQLLYQLRFWYARAEHWRNGRLWLVRKRAQLCADVAISRHQYDGALRRLKDAEVVEVEPHRSHYYGGETVSHIRLVTHVAAGPKWDEAMSDESASGSPAE